MLAKFMMEALFPDLGTESVSLHFLFFSLGGVLRLIGGILFGSIGDKFGRRTTFLYMTIFMAIATFCIGIFPAIDNYTIGFSCLFILRCVQSLSFGGEISGASTFAYESGRGSGKGTSIGFVFSGASIGALLATATLSFLTFEVSSSQVINGGWRIPFLVGGVLGFTVFFLRKSLYETKDFLKTEKIPHKKFLILKRYIPDLFFIFTLLLFPLSLIMLNIYFSFYLSTYFNIPIKLIYSAQTVGLIAAIFVAPLAGWLTYRIAPKTLLSGVFIFFITLMPLMLNFSLEASYLSLGSFFIFWQVILTSSLVWSMYYTLRRLPVEIRVMSTGIVYNFAVMVAGFVPTAIGSMYRYFDNRYLAFYVAIGIGFFSMGIFIYYEFFRKKTQKLQFS